MGGATAAALGGLTELLSMCVCVCVYCVTQLDGCSSAAALGKEMLVAASCQCEPKDLQSGAVQCHPAPPAGASWTEGGALCGFF